MSWLWDWCPVMNTHASFSLSFVKSVIIYGFILVAIQQKRNCYSSLICDCRTGQSEHVWNYLLKYNVFVLVIGEKVCVVWDWVQTPTYTHSRWSDSVRWFYWIIMYLCVHWDWERKNLLECQGWCLSFVGQLAVLSRTCVALTQLEGAVCFDLWVW